MNKLFRGEKQVAGLILVILLLTTLLFVVPAIAYGDGIDEPADGLNSTSPSGTQESTTSVEYLVLFTALNLLI